MDVHFLKSRLKISLDYFLEERKDILINRKTIPLLTGKDYYDVDPDLAKDVPERMKEFENLVQRTHRSGLKVIISDQTN